MPPEMPTANQFHGSLFSNSLSRTELDQVTADYRLMLICILNTILERYERDPDYHFLDTKLSLVTGNDFESDDPIRGKAVIYPWIQGRGLEALAGHDIWLKSCEAIDEQLRTTLSSRIHNVMLQVLLQMERLRKINNGQLFFMMTPTGEPLRITDNAEVIQHQLPSPPQSNYSDLFYVKGMAAAAHALGLKDKLTEACDWFWRIHNDIQQGNFTSDQQQLDPRNKAAKHTKGRYSHGARMIGIGAASRFLKCTKDPAFQETGFAFIDYILTNHVNLKGESDCSMQYDMWEFTDKQGNPPLDADNTLLSDPGHACEFVGLAFDLIRACQTCCQLTEPHRQRITQYNRILPHILKQNFSNGFSPQGIGICKAFDLVSRKPMNSDMPWWSLPETMRAAIAAYHAAPNDRPTFGRIAAQCSNAFVHNYVKPDLNLMASQTINEAGHVVDVIPATPDADPGYHTGLSIIDFLEMC